MHIHKPYKNLLYLMPSLIGVTIFLVVPYLDVIRRSFLSGGDKGWVGLENYVMIFQNGAFRLAVKNTALFMCVSIPILMVLSLLIGVALQKKTPLGSIAKTGLLLPIAMPIASVAMIWRVLFANEGAINALLHIFGFEGLNWMDSNGAFWAVVFTYVWKNLGINVVLWIAGLSVIPAMIYEAAQVDGAGRTACFFQITIPNLKSTFFMITVLSFVNSFKVFREAYIVGGDYPHKSMYMMQHLFNNWFRDLSVDKLAAGAVAETIGILLIIGILSRIWRE